MKKTAAFLLAIFAAMNSYAFDWPQDETESDSFYSYFGQLRGGTISSSLIFKDTSTVKAAENGKVIAIICDHGNDFGWFESSLGNTVIVAHNDGLSTVYGNLEDGSVPPVLEQSKDVATGEVLGVSGNSGWQDGQSCLEFKVFDKTSSSAVNPRILMPRVGKELPLTIGTLTLNDKNGVVHNLSIERNLPSGTYTLYRTKQPVASPFKTTVAINGATVEVISYEMLRELNGKIGVSGNSHYTVKDVYPDKTRQLLATVQLIRGRNTITVRVSNILGSETSITYNIDAY